MAQLLRLATADTRPRMRSDHVETETGADIARSLELLRQVEGSAFTMISGAPGIGKTRALEVFCASMGYDAIYLTVAPHHGRPATLGSAILDRFSFHSNGKSLDLIRKTVSAYVGWGRVLVLDESQYLEKSGIEWLRVAAEDGGFKVVFCGDLALSDLVASIPQLQSRMLRPLTLRAASRADVAALMADAGISDPQSIDVLFGVARLKGGLRNVDHVLRLAELFAANGAVGLAEIRAAIIDLKLGER